MRFVNFIVIFHMMLFFAHWRFVFSKIRCLDTPFAFGSYFRVRSSYKKHLNTHTHTHTHIHPFNGPFSGTTRVGRYQKGNWILLKQETVSGSGISWAIGKSAPCSRQTTTPAPHSSVVFYRPDALPVAQPAVSKH